jgi:hypothetical protein
LIRLLFETPTEFLSKERVMTSLRGLLGFALAVAFAFAGKSLNAEENSGAIIEFDGLKSAAPADWKEEKVSSKMRLKQFRLPKTGDDKADAELVIFRGITGSAKENIQRWKGQFQPPEGKKIEDVSKVTEMKISGAEATYLDVSGSYLFKMRPFDADEKPQLRPDYRMLAVQFEATKTIYHIKLFGPVKTVEHYKKGFDEWLKAFK